MGCVNDHDRQTQMQAIYWQTCTVTHWQTFLCQTSLQRQQPLEASQTIGTHHIWAANTNTVHYSVSPITSTVLSITVLCALILIVGSMLYCARNFKNISWNSAWLWFESESPATETISQADATLLYDRKD